MSALTFGEWAQAARSLRPAAPPELTAPSPEFARGDVLIYRSDADTAATDELVTFEMSRPHGGALVRSAAGDILWVSRSELSA